MARFLKPNLMFIPSLSGQTDLGGLTHQSEVIKTLSTKFNVIIISDKVRPYKKKWKTQSGFGYLPRSRNEHADVFEVLSHILKSIMISLFVVKRKKISVIYVRHGIASIPALIAGKISDVPVVVEVNGILSDERNILQKVDIVSKALKFLDKLASRHSTKIIAVTEGIKDYFVREFQKPKRDISVVPNGANTDIFRPMNMAQCKKELNLKNDVRYVIFVGTLAPWQGVENLIRAVPKVEMECPDVEYIIVGRGPMEKAWVNLAKKENVRKKVHFVGLQPYERIPAIINSGELCVAPFVKKRNMRIGLSPLKIFEYAACGKPIIASKIKGLEFVRGKDIGVLVEPENPDALSSAIVKLLNHEKRLNDMGENGRKLVESEFSWVAAGKKIIAICEKTITESSGE